MPTMSREGATPTGTGRSTNYTKGLMLEHLVAILERAVSPTGRVLTRHFIEDRDSGGRREIDLLIEDTFRHEPVRIAIECRNHQKRVDVKFIDYIAGKRAAVGIHDFRVVSRSGYTKEAIAKARALGIRLSTLAEVEDPAWALWLRSVPIVEITKEPGELQHLAVRSTDAPVVPFVVPLETLALMRPERVLDWPLLNEAGAKMATIGECIERADMEALAPSLQDGSRQLVATYRAVLTLEGAYLPSPAGLVPIACIDIGVRQATRARDLTSVFSEYRAAVGWDGRQGSLVQLTLADGTQVVLGRAHEGGEWMLSAIPKEPGAPIALQLGVLGTTTDGQDKVGHARIQSADGHAPLVRIGRGAGR